MKKILVLIILNFVLIFGINNLLYAQDETKDSFLITQDSIGIIKIGTPLEDVKKTAKFLGYKVKKDNSGYTLYDKNNFPVLNFTTFSSHTRTRPIRTIKTTSSRFKLPSGLSLIGTPIADLEAEYSFASIYRIKPKPDSPEFIDFKKWPFSESIVKGPYMIKYKAQLNKLVDEFGKIMSVGKYPTEFAMYADEYVLDARVESFLIEAIEPKIKFDKTPD
ncbi:MAG: hypothetical protein AB1782_07735 [Cyanobacteriota bacterium]